jgi:hypothetical protein
MPTRALRSGLILSLAVPDGHDKTAAHHVAQYIVEGVVQLVLFMERAELFQAWIFLYRPFRKSSSCSSSL